MKCFRCNNLATKHGLCITCHETDVRACLARLQSSIDRLALIRRQREALIYISSLEARCSAMAFMLAHPEMQSFLLTSAWAKALPRKWNHLSAV